MSCQFRKYIGSKVVKKVTIVSGLCITYKVLIKDLVFNFMTTKLLKGAKLWRGGCRENLRIHPVGELKTSARLV